MKVALTGGTGFIGTRIVRILRERGHEVVCVVRTPDKAAALAKLGATLVRGDILDRASLEQGFAGAEGVLHIAASYELGIVGKKAEEALQKNLEGTRNALEAARDCGAKKIVYTSSIVVYGNTFGKPVPEGFTPQSIHFPSPHPTQYALSKARAHYEVAVPMMKAGVPIIIVQPGAVFGPNDHSTLRVIWGLMAYGLPIVMGGAVYGVVDVEDCAMGHVLALEKGRPGECYHLVDENVSLAELAKRAAAASGVADRAIVFPDWMLGLNAAVMSLVERYVPVPDILSSDALRGMTAWLNLTVEGNKARAELGWVPRPMAEGLREVMADAFDRRGKKLPALLASRTRPS
jgi:nucleoside-diphosphate-sugar epimerase